MNNSEIYLKTAILSAKKAGPVFKKFFGKAADIQMKNNDFRDLVTEVDKKIETQIRKTLHKKFPTHKIIGEEFSKDEVGKNDLVWILDPIDGTTNYIQGIPFCCISIALWDNQGPLAAVLYNPVLNQMFSAARGQGAKLNSKPVTVSKENRLLHALGGVGWLKVEDGLKLFTLMADVCRKLRILASSAWQIGLVGGGNYDFQISYDINVWDYGAAILITTEAGGKATDWQGKPVTLTTRSVVASNGKIHSQLLKVLKKLAH